jgi:hypothetical protein
MKWSWLFCLKNLNTIEHHKLFEKLYKLLALMKSSLTSFGQIRKTRANIILKCHEKYLFRVPHFMRFFSGMNIQIPVWQIHHDPNIWPEPLTFDPERYFLFYNMIFLNSLAITVSSFSFAVKMQNSTSFDNTYYLVFVIKYFEACYRLYVMAYCELSLFQIFT